MSTGAISSCRLFPAADASLQLSSSQSCHDGSISAQLGVAVEGPPRQYRRLEADGAEVVHSRQQTWHVHGSPPCRRSCQWHPDEWASPMR